MDYVPENPSFSSLRSLLIETITDVLNTHAIRISMQDLQAPTSNEGNKKIFNRLKERFHVIFDLIRMKKTNYYLFYIRRCTNVYLAY